MRRRHTHTICHTIASPASPYSAQHFKTEQKCIDSIYPMYKIENRGKQKANAIKVQYEKFSSEKKTCLVRVWEIMLFRRH